MNVIPPISITDTILTYSNINEPDTGEVTWSSGSFTAGQVRILTSTHRQYQCLIAGTHTASPETDPTNWYDIGPTNRYAMFDTLRNSATTATGSTIEVHLAPGERADSVALLQMTGVTTVTINTTGYSYTHSGSTNMVIFDIFPFVSNVITIVLTGTTPTCGACVIGKYVDLGTVQNSAQSDVINFSTVERDEWGNANLVQRRNVPKTNQTLFIEAEKVLKAKNVRDQLNAVPAVWVGMNTDNTSVYYNTLLMLGIYKTFSLTLDNNLNAMLSLELEEL